MPIYQYKCQDCGNVDDEIFPNRHSAPQFIKCSKCHSSSKYTISTPMINMNWWKEAEKREIEYLSKPMPGEQYQPQD